jgi:hypothetical protein
VQGSYSFQVSNPTPALFPNISFSVVGAPTSWFGSIPPGTSLSPYSSKTFTLLVNASASAGQVSSRPVTVQVRTNGFVAGSFNTTLTNTPALHKIDYSYVVVPVVTSGDVVNEFQVTMTVTNRGNVAEKYITPGIPDNSAVNYSATPKYLDLAPGETGSFSISFWPSSGESPSQNLPVTITSQSGSASSQTIVLPAMTALAVLGSRQLPSWFYVAAAVIILAIAMLLISRYKEPARMEPMERYEESED